MNRKKPTGISEAEFQRQVTQLARLLGWRVYHTHDSRHSESGFPDLVLVRKGEIVFAELKVGDNEATGEQVAWLDDLRETGAAAGVWRPSDWKDIERVLNGEGGQ